MEANHPSHIVQQVDIKALDAYYSQFAPKPVTKPVHVKTKDLLTKEPEVEIVKTEPLIEEEVPSEPKPFLRELSDCVIETLNGISEFNRKIPLPKN